VNRTESVSVTSHEQTFALTCFICPSQPTTMTNWQNK